MPDKIRQHWEELQCHSALDGALSPLVHNESRSPGTDSWGSTMGESESESGDELESTTKAKAAAPVDVKSLSIKVLVMMMIHARHNTTRQHICVRARK